MSENIKRKTYFVKGMHCSACEILVERELLEEKNIKRVDASIKSDSVSIEYTDNAPNVDKLNHKFKEAGYTFSETPFESSKMSLKKNYWCCHRCAWHYNFISWLK